MKASETICAVANLAYFRDTTCGKLQAGFRFSEIKTAAHRRRSKAYKMGAAKEVGLYSFHPLLADVALAVSHRTHLSVEGVKSFDMLATGRNEETMDMDEEWSPICVVPNERSNKKWTGMKPRE